jgi:hypothetical protein
MKLTYREIANLRLLGAEYVYSGETPNLHIATVMAHNRVTGDDVPIVTAHIHEGMLEAARKHEALVVARRRAASKRFARSSPPPVVRKKKLHRRFPMNILARHFTWIATHLGRTVFLFFQIQKILPIPTSVPGPSMRLPRKPNAALVRQSLQR